MANTHDLYRGGLIDARSALALLCDDAGWSEDTTRKLLDELAAPPPPDRQEYRTWTDDELDAVDAVLESTAWRMPSTAEIRMLAETFDRTPKSVQSQLERRISTVERLDAHMAAMRAERKACASSDRHDDPLCGCKIDAASHSCGPGRCRECGR